MDPAARRSHELGSEEEVMRILISGTEEEITELLTHIKLRRGTEITREQFDTYRILARTRQSLIDQANRETEERKARAPRASDDEYAIGAYRERLEPEVRDAVFDLHKKRYVSFESGFHGMDRQSIGFEVPVAALNGFALPDSARNAFDAADAVPEIDAERVGYRMTRPLTEEEMRHLWKVLTDALPESTELHNRTDVGTALDFRENQDRMFGPRNEPK